MIGLPHPSGRAAMRMLENEGFAYEKYVDIFDGGPTMTARTDRVKSIEQARESRIITCDRDGGAESLVAAGRLGEFRCAYGDVREVGDGIVLGDGCAKALGVGEDDVGSTCRGCECRGDQFRRDRRVEPQLCGAVAGQSRGDGQCGRGVASARGGAAGHRQDANQSGARADAGDLVAPRPARWVVAERAATDYASAPDHLRAQAMSASAMWAANAATVSPAADTGDGVCHLTVANLVTMPHRSHEARQTLRQLMPRLRRAWGSWCIPPSPLPFGDEGAANHMRLCAGA